MISPHYNDVRITYYVYRYTVASYVHAYSTRFLLVKCMGKFAQFIAVNYNKLITFIFLINRINKDNIPAGIIEPPTFQFVLSSTDVPINA